MRRVDQKAPKAAIHFRISYIQAGSGIGLKISARIIQQTDVIFRTVFRCHVRIASSVIFGNRNKIILIGPCPRLKCKLTQRRAAHLDTDSFRGVE